MQDALESIPDDLAEARAKLEATCDGLQRAVEGQDGDMAPIRQAIAKLDRMAAEIARIERAISEQATEIEV